MVDPSAYWSTILQVVPVLFIAVMIEFRYMIRRVAEDQEGFARARGLRVLLGLMLVAISVLLLVAFLNALRGLAGNVSLADPRAAWAAIALSTAAGVAIGPPGIYLSYMATQDVWLSLHRKMPWSRVGKLISEVQGHRREAEYERRRQRNLRLEVLVNASRLYVRASQAEREGGGHVAEMYSTADAAFSLVTALRDQARSECPELPDLTALTFDEREYIRERLADEASRSSS